MNWEYDKATLHSGAFRASLRLVDDNRIIREFHLVDADNLFELREHVDNKQITLSGRGWSRYNTELNCTETLLKLTEDEGYPEIPKEVLQNIWDYFDDHPYKYRPRPSP